MHVVTLLLVACSIPDLARSKTSRLLKRATKTLWRRKLWKPRKLQLIVEKGKIRKGQTYCVAGAPNDVSFENNTYIPGISIHSFPKDLTVSLWPNWTRFTRRHRGDFTLHCRLNMLCNGLEDGYYEHIPQVKSGKDNQWIQLKIILIKGPVPTPYTVA